VINYLYDLSDQIKIGLSNHLSGQVSPISRLSQSPVQILSNNLRRSRSVLACKKSLTAVSHDIFATKSIKFEAFFLAAFSLQKSR